MILVTVGMHTEGFARLAVEMDRIAAEIDEAIVMQIGVTPYTPRAARWFDFTTQENMEALCEQARVIVSHAGAGSILTALRLNKPMIVMPRRRKHGECVDDHQLELATALSRAGVLLVAYEPDELRARIEDAENLVPTAPNHNRLIEAVRQAVVTEANARR